MRWREREVLSRAIERTYGNLHWNLRVVVCIRLHNPPLFRSVMNSRFRFRSCEEHLQPHLLATEILFFGMKHCFLREQFQFGYTSRKAL